MPQDKKDLGPSPGAQARKDEMMAIDSTTSIGSTKEVPKASSTISRLKNTPKDTIPISKAPRRQRSSRFHVTERVELEKLAGFKGKWAFHDKFMTRLY